MDLGAPYCPFSAHIYTCTYSLLRNSEVHIYTHPFLNFLNLSGSALTCRRTSMCRLSLPYTSCHDK